VGGLSDEIGPDAWLAMSKAGRTTPAGSLPDKAGRGSGTLAAWPSADGNGIASKSSGVDRPDRSQRYAPDAATTNNDKAIF
jgi:hypothetical protein